MANKNKNKIHNSTSCVSIGAFPEAANSGYPNVMSNQSKMPN